MSRWLPSLVSIGKELGLLAFGREAEAKRLRIKRIKRAKDALTRRRNQIDQAIAEKRRQLLDEE